jgi:hypothetical protein
VAVVGPLFAMTLPSSVTYCQAAAPRSDVQPVITLFNQARELAIKQNVAARDDFPQGP